MMGLLSAAMLLLTPCTQVGGQNSDSYMCPADVDSQVEVDEGESLVLWAYLPGTASLGGWQCDNNWCSFDFGVVEDDATVDLPGNGCECSRPTKKILIKVRPHVDDDPPPPPPPPPPSDD